MTSSPLGPNVNVHATGFAGSIYSAAVLTGWALCTHIMDEMNIEGTLVVREGVIRYKAPVTGDIICRSTSCVAERNAFKMRFSLTVGPGWRWK